MKNEVPFAAVPAGLASALEAKGFKELTAVQKAVLDPELAGRDVRVSSQTGSGKTVAIGFLIAPELVDLSPRAGKTGKWGRRSAQPRALVVAPTRELAAQLAREFTWLYRPLGARVTVVTGGTSVGGEVRELSAGPDVVVGTPGRLVDHLKSGAIDLSALGAVVLDEADEMLDMGFRDDLEAILDTTPAERRTHIVSATLPREALALAKRYQTDAVQVTGTPVGSANDDITHVAHVVGVHDRLSALINVLLAAPGHRGLVFVRTRAATAQVAGALAGAGFTATPISGELSQRERTSTLQAFRSGGVQVLVATDVASRGLDIADVPLVVHYDAPENSDSFTHRSGRTGRAGNKGMSVALVPPRGRRGAEHMFRRARVEATWLPVPTPADIRAAADAQLLEELTAESTNTDARATELAEKLLASGDAVAVVAALLARSNHAGPCEPHDVRAPHAPEARFSRGGRDDRPRSDRPRLERSHSGKRGGDRSYTPFSVTWGGKNGANPSRLLAMVCRRGDIRSNSVGAIHVGEFRSIVDISDDAAEAFAQACQRPDPRNPRVSIGRFDDKKGRSNRAPHAGHKSRDRRAS